MLSPRLEARSGPPESFGVSRGLDAGRTLAVRGVEPDCCWVVGGVGRGLFPHTVPHTPDALTAHAPSASAQPQEGE